MTYYIEAERAREFIINVLNKENVDNEVALLASNGMIHTSLRGVDTHGIRLLSHYLKGFREGRLNKNPQYDFNQTTSTTAVFDADHTIGYAGCFVA